MTFTPPAGWYAHSRSVFRRSSSKDDDAYSWSQIELGSPTCLGHYIDLDASLGVACDSCNAKLLEFGFSHDFQKNEFEGYNYATHCCCATLSIQAREKTEGKEEIKEPQLKTPSRAKRRRLRSAKTKAIYANK